MLNILQQTNSPFLRDLQRKTLSILGDILNINIRNTRVALQIVEMKVFLIKFQIITRYELFT